MDSERSNLLKFVSSQNDHLVKSINEIEDKKTTDNQISNYKNEQVTWFHDTNRMLLYFYYLLALVLIYLLYMKIEGKNPTTWNFQTNQIVFSLQTGFRTYVQRNVSLHK